MTIENSLMKIKGSLMKKLGSLIKKLNMNKKSPALSPTDVEGLSILLTKSDGLGRHDGISLSYF